MPGLRYLFGPEIREESKKVLNRVGEVFGYKFEYESQFSMGGKSTSARKGLGRHPVGCNPDKTA